jgi:hypothetical protein
VIDWNESFVGETETRADEVNERNGMEELYGRETLEEDIEEWSF